MRGSGVLVMRYNWVLFFLLLILMACTSQKLSVERSDYKCLDCNIILISIDTLRGDHLTCAGYKKYDVDITKNICKLAEAGVMFTNAIAQAPSTEPSHASIFTSTIPSHHQAFFSRNQSIALDKITLAELLKGKGYRTAAFTGGGQVSADFGFDRGFEIYEEEEDLFTSKFSINVQKSLDWLNKTKGKKFLFLHTYEVHHPYSPKQEYAKILDPEYNGTLGINITKELLLRISHRELNITPSDLGHIIAMYDAEIWSVDGGIGYFMDELKVMNLYDNAIIVLTSDHGEEFNEHGRVGWHSNTLFNELLHVPLIVYAPGIESGVDNKLVRGIDIAPTLLNMLEIAIPRSFEGQSLFADEELPAISERDMAGKIPFAVQTSLWKFYQDGNKKMLFNLVNDSYEKINVSHKYPGIAKEYIKMYKSALNQTNFTVEKAAVSDETMERLRSLGYVN